MTTDGAPSEEPSATEAGWAANRRAFVADARDEAADEREHIADKRDTAADDRDRVAGDRERLLDERERELDNRARDSGLAVPGRDPAKRARRVAADARRAEARVRGEAATARSHAGRARAGAAARRGPGDRLLAREFAQLAVALYGAESFEKVLAGLVEVAADAVPGCDQASITLVEAGEPRTPAASGEAAEALDELQYRFGEGPCLDALDAVMVTATGDEWRRWPRLQAAKPEGVETVVSCGLLLPAGGPTGSLNLYGSAPDAIDAESRQIALVLAAHAAIAVATARERQGAVDLEYGLREALASRDVIGQAKGILMGRQGISADDAFDVLRRASQRLNVKLRDLARDLSEGVALTAATDTAIEAGTLAGAVGELLDRANDLAPDQLPDLGRVVGATTGVRSTRMWLADYEQRRLVPFGQPPEIDGFDIDGTVGGQAFRLAEPRELARDDGVLLWVPLVDGTERLGVVQFELDRLDAYRRGTLLTIAKLLASEIVTRSRYTDALEVARRTRDLTLAAELQWNLLRPRNFATPDVTVAAALEPSYGFGGDGYDYAYNDGMLHVGAFDAVGHDLDAGIVASLFVVTWRWCRRRGLDLDATVRTIDAILNERFPDAKYATGILAELDVFTGAFRWVNAGHPPPILVRGATVVGPLLGPSALPIGLASFLKRPVAVSVHELSLQPDDRIVLYSDGVVEARTGPGEGFGVERLQDFVHRAVASGSSGAEMVRRLAHAVVDHHGDHLRDDATIVVIHWHPAKPRA